MLNFVTSYGDSSTLYRIKLSDVEPSSVQPRLFIEREGLADLEDLYTKERLSPGSVVLPDPPILREIAPHKFECLAGHRRITAALNAGLKYLYFRVVHMSDKEAYEFVMAHNMGVEQLTTVEVAYRAAEMERLGYSDEEISAHLGGVSVTRYVAVGKLVNPDHFNDRPKLCNPGITTWFEAALHGPVHFETCFNAWNNGVWNEYHCNRYFRKRGKVLPLDNNEKGLRITVSLDSRKLKIRGTLDLDLLAPYEVEEIAQTFVMHFNRTLREYAEAGNFGPRKVVNINPDTLHE